MTKPILFEEDNIFLDELAEHLKETKDDLNNVGYAVIKPIDEDDEALVVMREGANMALQVLRFAISNAGINLETIFENYLKNKLTRLSAAEKENLREEFRLFTRRYEGKHFCQDCLGKGVQKESQPIQ